MEVSYAFLARGGEFAPDGSLSVFGGDISTIHANVFPAQIPTITLLAKLVFAKEEWGRRYQFKIEVVGPDNVNLAPEIKQDFEVAVPQDPEKKFAMNLAVMINGIQFPQPGNYRVRMLLDGQEIRSLGLELICLTNQEQPSIQMTKQLR
jgi:hypothetical protein